MSKTAIQRREAERNSRLFYYSHCNCKDCKCALSENEYKYCSDCEKEMKNYNNAFLGLQNICPDKTSEDIHDAISKVFRFNNEKLRDPITESDLEAIKEHLNEI